jgi:ParB-like chromosome segregation protein Spo0J
LREGLSVRKVEALAQEDKKEGKQPKEKPENPYEMLEKELSTRLGAKVKIQENKLTISCSNEQELLQIVNKLS